MSEEMGETKLIEVDNDTLQKEFIYFSGICKKSQNNEARNGYIKEIERVFDESDKKHNGKIDRKEFESLIRGYFNLKGLKSTKENFDYYFDKLDIDHDHTITKKDFIDFMD